MNCVLGKGIQKDSMSQNASSPGKIFSDESDFYTLVHFLDLQHVIKLAVTFSIICINYLNKNLFFLRLPDTSEEYTPMKTGRG